LITVYCDDETDMNASDNIVNMI